MSTRNAEEEIRVYDELPLELIDPEEKFTIYKPRSCRVQPKYQAKMASGCKVALDKPLNLQYTDGGESYYSYISHELYAERLFVPLLNIFYIVSKII